MFDLKQVISSSSASEPDDIAQMRFALTSLGYYDDTKSMLSPYTDNDLFVSIKTFQKDNDLKIDGVVNPDGPTHKTVVKKLESNPIKSNAFGDFKRNFEDMKRTNVIDGDKYFHCKANYEASSRGWSGGIIAKTLSDSKELKDKYFTGYDDGERDQEANKYGRDAAKSGRYSNARDACSIFRPESLDENY